MIILEDTRNKLGKHKNKHAYFKNAGIDVFRTKLPIGDYSVVGSNVFIDTKASLEELYSNVTREHRRFREECKLAQDLGANLIILTENEVGIHSLENLKNKEIKVHARKVIDGDTLFKICSTMQERYAVKFKFCEPWQAGEIILRTLLKIR